MLCMYRLCDFLDIRHLMAMLTWKINNYQLSFIICSFSMIMLFLFFIISVLRWTLAISIWNLSLPIHMIDIFNISIVRVVELRLIKMDLIFRWVLVLLVGESWLQLTGRSLKLIFMNIVFYWITFNWYLPWCKTLRSSPLRAYTLLPLYIYLRLISI